MKEDFIFQLINVVGKNIIDWHINDMKAGLPKNIEPSELALKKCWDNIRNDLASSPELKHLAKLYSMTNVPRIVISKEQFDYLTSDKGDYRK